MILLLARKLNFSVQYEDDKWNSFRASAWAQKTLLIPSSSSCSWGRNSFLSLWDSPLRCSLLAVCFPSQSGFLEFVVSSWQCCWTICHKKHKFSIFLGYQDFLRIQSSEIFSNASNFSIRQSQQSEYLLPKFSPRTQHVLEGFSKSSFMLRFPICQDVLVISQIATAFHRILLPLIIRSRLQ